MDINNDVFNQLNQFNTTLYKTWQELGAINNKTVQRLTELQFNLASLNVEGGLRQVELLSSAHDGKEMFAVESKFAADYSRQALEVAQKAMRILGDARDDLSVWIEDTMSSVNEGVNAAQTQTQAQTKKTTASARRKAS